MDLRRRSFAALVVGAAVLCGCVSTPVSKPAPVVDTPGVVAPIVKAPPGPAPLLATDQADPSGLKARLRSFIAGDGLATTQAKVGEPARLTAAWNNKVIYAPDPTHGGDPVPGLMGKMWVFGPDISVPLSLDGEIFVGAWDNGPTINGGQPVLLEAWHIDPEAAKKIRRRDFIGGEAYNLFLPWSQYTVDLKQINVVARFNAPDGRSLVSAPETLTLDHSATLERAREKLAGLSSGSTNRPPAAGPAPNVTPPGTLPQLPINFPEAPRK
jgi:hypothetical protein